MSGQREIDGAARNAEQAENMRKETIVFWKKAITILERLVTQEEVSRDRLKISLKAECWEELPFSRGNVYIGGGNGIAFLCWTQRGDNEADEEHSKRIAWLDGTISQSNNGVPPLNITDEEEAFATALLLSLRNVRALEGGFAEARQRGVRSVILKDDEWVDGGVVNNNTYRILVKLDFVAFRNPKFDFKPPSLK